MDCLKARHTTWMVIYIVSFTGPTMADSEPTECWVWRITRYERVGVREIILKTQRRPSKHGGGVYERLVIIRKDLRVHRVVAKAIIGVPGREWLGVAKEVGFYYRVI